MGGRGARSIRLCPTPNRARDPRHTCRRDQVAGIDRAAISRQTFDVGNANLANRLASLSQALHEGRGVAVLRGLDAARFNDEEAVIAFAGVCAYVCPQRATDSYANQTLSHVRDATHDLAPAGFQPSSSPSSSTTSSPPPPLGLAGSKLTSALDFHSDRFAGDVLALHVRNDGAATTAPGGGTQYLASFWKIYNELLHTDPAVLETMAEPTWPFELKQKDQTPYLELGPTLFFSQNKPICQLVKAPLQGTPLLPRDARMPALSARQKHALRSVEQLARRFCTPLNRKQGDVQFVHNLSILHARTAYHSRVPGMPSDRHLLRMFLRDPDHAWQKPARFQASFDDPFAQGRQQNLPIVDSDPWRLISGRESHG